MIELENFNFISYFANIIFFPKCFVILKCPQYSVTVSIVIDFIPLMAHKILIVR